MLEIGGGGSRVHPYLGLNFGFEVCGTDFSFTGCRLLRANLGLMATPGWVVCEDFLRSSLRAESFDLVYSSGLIEHFEDTREVVVEDVRLLKPGGRLVLIVPNLQGLQGKLIEKLAPPLWRVHKVLGPDELAGILASLGLTGIRTGYLGSFFIHVGCNPEWSALRDWPAWLRLWVHRSVRAFNGVVALLFSSVASSASLANLFPCLFCHRHQTGGVSRAPACGTGRPPGAVTLVASRTRLSGCIRWCGRSWSARTPVSAFDHQTGKLVADEIDRFGTGG